MNPGTSSGAHVVDARGWIVIASAVVSEAAAQAALVAMDAAWPAGAAVGVVLSTLVAVIGLALVLDAVSAGRRSVVRALGIAAVAVVVVAAGDVVNPIVGAAAAWVGLPLAVGGVVGARGWRSAPDPFRRHPLVAVVALLVSALALVLLAIAALLLGLFVSGWASAVMVWLLTGIAVSLLLVWWARLHSEAGATAASRPDVAQGPSDGGS